MCHWLLETGADVNAVDTVRCTYNITWDYELIAFLRKTLHYLASEHCDDEWYVKSKWERNHPICNPNYPIQVYQTARELVEFGQMIP
jgi:hypothetical protein